jgi:hypothetical protein
MGTAAAGIIIHKTTKQINESIDFVKGRDFEKVSYCDCRKPECIYTGQINETLALINSELSENFFGKNEIEEVFLKFFDSPELIFVFEEYDSGASYGYAIFKEGKLIRKLRASNYNDIDEEFGIPDEDELEWINGTEIKDTDNSILLRNSINGYEIPLDYKYKAILQLLMEKKFGFTCETMDDIFSLTGHFSKMIENKEEQIDQLTQNEVSNSAKNKWWKFW